MSADGAGLLSRCLRAAGVTRAFRAPGHSLPAPAGIEVLDVPSDELAVVLADADGRLATAAGARPGLALLDGRRIRLTSSPGEQAFAHPLLDPADLPAAIGGWTVGRVHGALELDLDLDLAAPAPEGLDPLSFTATDERLVTLSPTMAAFATVIVVGSGVVRDGQVPGVAEAARRTGAGVVATPGAVGVLPLDSPAWHGVVGLQVADAALSGLEGAELVVVAGLDPSEALGVVPPDAQVLEVEPWHLGLMAGHWPDPDPEPASGADADDADADAATMSVGSGRELVVGLAAVAAAGRGSTGLPLHPARAVADLAAVLDPEELVLADPGPAALWLARGLVTRPAGSVVVPSLPVHGFAAAGALVAALDHRPAVAVVTSPTDPVTDALLDLAASMDLVLVCEVWGADAPWGDPSEHRERLVGARHEGGVQRLGVPVDLAATRELIDLAGPVQAWTGGPDPSGSFG